MRGSVIVAVGVVPQACITPGLAPSTCSQSVLTARRHWERALWSGDSPLRHLLGQVDTAFPPYLDAAECGRLRLPCAWLGEGAVLGAQEQSPCGTHKACKEADLVSLHNEPWWFMSLIAFAG